MRKRREEEGVSTNRIAAAVCKKQPMISLIETGKRTIKKATVVRVWCETIGMKSPEIRSIMRDLELYDQKFVDALDDVRTSERKFFEAKIAKLMSRISDLETLLGWDKI